MVSNIVTYNNSKLKKTRVIGNSKTLRNISFNKYIETFKPIQVSENVCLMCIFSIYYAIHQKYSYHLPQCVLLQSVD